VVAPYLSRGERSRERKMFTYSLVDVRGSGMKSCERFTALCPTIRAAGSRILPWLQGNHKSQRLDSLLAHAMTLHFQLKNCLLRLAHNSFSRSLDRFTISPCVHACSVLCVFVCIVLYQVQMIFNFFTRKSHPLRNPTV
jgi:hypothetical protein